MNMEAQTGEKFFGNLCCDSDRARIKRRTLFASTDTQGTEDRRGVFAWDVFDRGVFAWVFLRIAWVFLRISVYCLGISADFP